MARMTIFTAAALFGSKVLTNKEMRRFEKMGHLLFYSYFVLSEL